jgi:hypothetical protein
VVADRLGDQVTLALDDELAIDTAVPDGVSIELPGERFADLASARAAVERQGGSVVRAVALPSAGGRKTVVARFPAARRDAALAALSDIDRRVHIGPARTTTRVRVSSLRRHDQGLVAASPGGELILRTADILAIRTLAPVRIPGDAFLLVEGDRPRDHLRTLVIVIFLIGFALVNLMAVRRSA